MMPAITTLTRLGTIIQFEITMDALILSFVHMLRRDRMNGISVSQCILGMAELEEIRMIQSSELQSDRGDQKGLVRLCRDGVDMGMTLAIVERILSLYVVVHFECICVTFWGQDRAGQQLRN
jgi:hypothetical protein